MEEEERAAVSARHAAVKLVRAIVALPFAETSGGVRRGHRGDMERRSTRRPEEVLTAPQASFEHVAAEPAML
eukprot:15454321-Alexandrium_andersonii.AAC.1